jgi:hypothetical protein
MNFESMDEARKWEAILEEEGLPENLISEEEKAAREGVEITSMEMANSEAQELAEKLRQEDERNKLGGYPNSIEDTVALVETLREEWLAQGVSPKDIHLVIHASCINGSDCVTLAYNGGNIYHYNTKNIRGYSREGMAKKLEDKDLSFIEK